MQNPQIALIAGANKVSASKSPASLPGRGFTFSSAPAIAIGAKLPWQTSEAKDSPLAMCKSI